MQCILESWDKSSNVVSESEQSKIGENGMNEAATAMSTLTMGLVVGIVVIIGNVIIIIVYV